MGCGKYICGILKTQIQNSLILEEGEKSSVIRILPYRDKQCADEELLEGSNLFECLQ